MARHVRFEPQEQKRFHAFPSIAASGRSTSVRAFELSGLNEPPDARRRQRQFAQIDAERTQRRGDGIGNDAADRNDAAFAGAFRAERIERRRLVLERNRADVGKSLAVGSR